MNYNNIIQFGNNSMRYGDDVLRVSNISRTSIIVFQNIDRMRQEQKNRDYNKAKNVFTSQQNAKKTHGIIGIIVSCILALMMFSIGVTFIAVVLVAVAIACGIYVYIQANKEYPVDAPINKDCPDKYGLIVEMNSGYDITFSAVGNHGKQNLRDLQDKIHSIEPNGAFNLVENHITFEGSNINNGINTGIIGNENNVEELKTEAKVGV